MRKYMMPVTVFLALGTVVVVLVMLNRGDPDPTREDPASGKEPVRKEAAKSPFGEPRKTRTSLKENEWMSELERALSRPDLHHALYFRDKVCEVLRDIEADETLSRKLLDDIREHGIESKDPRKRDVILPMLRAFRHPEATRIIEEEYYRTTNQEEQMVLLEAMSHSYHNPELASEWAVDKALNSETEEDRIRALEVMRDFSEDYDVIVKTAGAVYEGTVRPTQRLHAIEAVSTIANNVQSGMDWVRKRLDTPRREELSVITAYLVDWGTEKDAARLEAIAISDPATAHMMREAAETIRMHLREKARAEGKITEEDDIAAMEALRRREEERQRKAAEQKAAEEAAAGRDG